jgi:hypothetical protein
MYRELGGDFWYNVEAVTERGWRIKTTPYGTGSGLG